MELKGKIIDLHFPECPVRNIISRINGKWPILVLLTLDDAKNWMRYKQIRQALPDISQKMLTQTLRDLEADGLIVRKVFAEIPPRVEYRLTPRARSLTPLLNQLVQWAAENMSGINNDRQKYFRKI